MRYDIQLSPDAVDDLHYLKANNRAKILDAFELFLRHEPDKESQSRIKRLKGLSSPQYRLRVDDFRVFYDINGSIVEIIALVSKERSVAWLKREGARK